MTRPIGRTALYELYDSARTFLYVGITNEPQIRFRTHSLEKDWWPEVVTRELTWYDTRAEAEAAEVIAIRTRNPRHNKAIPDENGRYATPWLTWRGTQTPSAGTAPLYASIATVLRTQIADGTLAAGGELRSEPDLCRDFDVSRKTVRAALEVLRSEGLIETRRGHRSRVRSRIEETPIAASHGTRVAARMPTPDERQRLGLPVGVPVLVVAGAVYPADRYTVVVE